MSYSNQATWRNRDLIVSQSGPTKLFFDAMSNLSDLSTLHVSSICAPHLASWFIIQ
jgi:hypothetical protein